MFSSGPISADPISGLVSQAPGAPAFDPNSVRGTRVSRQQDVSGAREVAGYAVTFGALAALLAGTPPQVGATNYEVGTHQIAIAQSQSPGFVRGTPPSLMPVAVTFVGRPIVANQQHVGNDSAGFYKDTPPQLIPAVLDPLIGRTRVAIAEQVYEGYASLWSGAPYLNVRVGRTLIAAPEQLDYSSSQVWGTAVPAVIAGADVAIGHFSFYAEAFYEPVQYGDVATPNTDLIPPAVVVVPPTDEPVPGPAGKRKHHRYYVEIDGQQFLAESADHARAILDRAADLAKQAATVQADGIASRLKKAKRIGLATPKIATNAPIDLTGYRDAIRKAYKEAAIEAELRMHMAMLLVVEKRRKEEEEAATLLLLT